MRDYYKMKRILYWPGMGQQKDILKHLRDELSKENIIDFIDFDYDKDELDPSKWNILKNKYDWWIGISLGASLLYYSYNFLKEEYRPKRITIINPFSSRKKLSEERNFDLSNQWNFMPKEQNINIEIIDLISSVYDSKIPMYHGIELLNDTNSKEKNLIFVNGGHTIDDLNAQIELAQILLNKGICNEGYNYCNIYKQ